VRVDPFGWGGVFRGGGGRRGRPKVLPQAGLANECDDRDDDDLSFSVAWHRIIRHACSCSMNKKEEINEGS
jgi:hypothetical protein